MTQNSTVCRLLNDVKEIKISSRTNHIDWKCVGVIAFKSLSIPQLKCSQLVSFFLFIEKIRNEKNRKRKKVNRESYYTFSLFFAYGKENLFARDYNDPLSSTACLFINFICFYRILFSSASFFFCLLFFWCWKSIELFLGVRNYIMNNYLITFLTLSAFCWTLYENFFYIFLGFFFFVRFVSTGINRHLN